MDDARTGTGLGMWFGLRGLWGLPRAQRLTVQGLVICLGMGIVMGVTLGGCSASSAFDPSGNPLLDVRNPSLLARDRVAAAEAAWGEVEAGVRVRGRTREAFKDLAWSRATDAPVRLTLIRLLMSDASEEGSADSENMARLMLPTERSPDVIDVIADAAVERGWASAVPALVRSYSRVSPNVPDEERSERRALGALVPGVPVEETVYRVFLSPGGNTDAVEDSVLRSSERTRDDAWTLLSRLDRDGRVRARLIAGGGVAGGSAEREVEMLRASLRELGVLPRTGEELGWLRRLWYGERESDRVMNRAWWVESAAAVSRLGEAQRRGLELRHVEAIRWAAAHRGEWIGLDRGGLLDALESRLRERPRVMRKAERGQRPRPERLRDHAEAMTWADVLTLLVVDEALAGEAMRGQVFEQVDLDRRDTTTEYGGILETASGDSGAYRAVLFRPRARDRVSDEAFVASGDMIRFSDRALVHYHLQVSDERLSNLAGPSLGDLQYAAVSGRTCLVFTSIGADILNVDVYTPDGEILDLGYFER